MCAWPKLLRRGFKHVRKRGIRSGSRSKWRKEYDFQVLTGGRPSAIFQRTSPSTTNNHRPGLSKADLLAPTFAAKDGRIATSSSRDRRRGAGRGATVKVVPTEDVRLLVIHKTTFASTDATKAPGDAATPRGAVLFVILPITFRRPSTHEERTRNRAWIQPA